jgi:hypothetical protein
VTWEGLVAVEPRLDILLAKAHGVKDDKRERSFCANAIWFGYNNRPSMRAMLSDLVGWSSQNDALQSSPAYDLAYDKVYGALPDCRKCLCMVL